MHVGADGRDVLQYGAAWVLAGAGEAGDILKNDDETPDSFITSPTADVVRLGAGSGCNGRGQISSLKVIGLYSLSADRDAYSRFIKEQVDASDPANFSEDVKEKLRRLGHEPQPYTAEDRQEKEEDLRYHMDEAAVLEVLVTNPDTSFDVGKFIQPDPARPEGFWQVAWNEKFLKPDGETPIELDRTQKLPTASQYRVVFVIHFWLPSQPLRSSYGELILPAMQPLPERLWRLAPYEVPS